MAARVWFVNNENWGTRIRTWNAGASLAFALAGPVRFDLGGEYAPARNLLNSLISKS
jgi:hypothetical protein